MNSNLGINLRPWRDERRQKQQKKFALLSALALLIGLLLSTLLWKNTTLSLAAIREESQLINQHMLQLNHEIKEVTNLREKRQQLLKRIEVIQNLQSNRPVTVDIMDQLALSMNDGIFLVELEREKDQIKIQGRAQPSQAVATFMRSLNSQLRFGEPLLRSLSSDDKTNLTRFDLQLPLREPK